MAIILPVSLKMNLLFCSFFFTAGNAMSICIYTLTLHKQRKNVYNAKNFDNDEMRDHKQA